MKSFDDIVNSLHEDFKPQSRTLIDLGILLSKAYSVLGDEKFKEFTRFKKNNSVLHTQNQIIKGLIDELGEIDIENSTNYMVKSEGIERFIKDIKTLELESEKPLIEEAFMRTFNFGELKAQLLYLVYTSREGLIRLKKKVVLSRIAELDNKEERLEYLDSLVDSMRKTDNFYDEVQYTSLIKFIDCELTKWQRVVENSKDFKSFSSSQELHDFMVELIRNKLEPKIRKEKGFLRFWRDKDMKAQTKENEFYPYIKSILEPHCNNRNISICSENVVSNGRIDLTFSSCSFKVCMEIKKAHHKDAIEAINTHFTDYMDCQRTEYGIFLLLWYKCESYFEKPKKYHDLNEMISDIVIESDDYQYQILGIECTKPNCCLQNQLIYQKDDLYETA